MRFVKHPEMIINGFYVNQTKAYYRQPKRVNLEVWWSGNVGNYRQFLVGYEWNNYFRHSIFHLFKFINHKIKS